MLKNWRKSGRRKINLEGRDSCMSNNKNKNVAKIHSSYIEQQEANKISSQRRKKLLYRRLTVFFVFVAVVSVFMITTIVSQSAALDEKKEEKVKLAHQLKELEQSEKALNEEIVRLHDEEYLEKLARRDYYLSEQGEIIFKMPDETDEKEKKENESAQ